MTFDLGDILRSKQEYRLKLTALPIMEKLRLLDQLRERHLTIAACRPSLARPMSEVLQNTGGHETP